MNYYYITGTGKGIGKALALELLKNKNNYVIGLSRNNKIKHKHFEFIKIDLSEFNSTEEFQFIDIHDADKIILINNAGILGNVKHIGNTDNFSIYQTLMVNTISPAILTNNFIKAYQKVDAEKIILNISSGAGRHAIESWGAYCASKAALDMFSQVVSVEQSLTTKTNPIKIFSVAPGIIDTQMQDQIRKTNKNDFSMVNTFINYKKEQQLYKPEKAAKLLISLLYNPNKYEDVLLDIRTID